jgi:flagellar capping protein FliD
MAEVEYKGIKIGGSKLLLILPLIATLGGGLWAGFEFYKDYMNMRSKIERYTAPDLSGFDKKLAVMAKSVKETRREMVSVRTRVGEIQTVTRDIREDTRADAGKLYSELSAVEARSRALDSETRGVVRVSEETVRGLITKSEKVVREMISVSKKSGQDAAEALATRLDNKINAANVRFDAKLGQMDIKIDALEKRLKNTSKEHLSSMKKAGVNMQGVISRNEKTVRDVVESAATRLDNKINSANTRFDTKITQVDTKLDVLEKRIRKAIKRALDNPILRGK